MFFGFNRLKTWEINSTNYKYKSLFYEIGRFYDLQANIWNLPYVYMALVSSNRHKTRQNRHITSHLQWASLGCRQPASLNWFYHNSNYILNLLKQSFCLYPISSAISKSIDFTYETDSYFSEITIFGIDIFRSFLHFLVSYLVSNIEIGQILYIWKKNGHENWVSTIVLITVKSCLL